MKMVFEDYYLSLEVKVVKGGKKEIVDWRNYQFGLLMSLTFGLLTFRQKKD
jgi:hypothetical protein